MTSVQYHVPHIKQPLLQWDLLWKKGSQRAGEWKVNSEREWKQKKVLLTDPEIRQNSYQSERCSSSFLSLHLSPFLGGQKYHLQPLMSQCGSGIMPRNNPRNWGIIFFVSCYSVFYLGYNGTMRKSWADKAGNRAKSLKAKGHDCSITTPTTMGSQPFQR